MKLREQHDAFLAGKVDKARYIQTMYEEHHAHLFDYSSYLSNTDIKKIEISDQGVIFTTREHDIKLFSLEQDFRIAPLEILNFSRYEPEDTDMMLQLLPRGARVFDIGGNAGWNAILFAKVDSEAQIFSFEPIPKTYELLTQNIRLNGCENIEIFDFGLSDTNDLLKFYYYPEGSGNASSAKLSDRDTLIEVQCNVRTMDSCIGEVADGIDFIKCDVEGAELMVFKGGEESIEKYKPIVFTEMLRKWSAAFNYHPNDVIQFFAEKNYACYTAESGYLKEFFNVDESTVQTNYFFLNKDKHRAQIDRFAKP